MNETDALVAALVTCMIPCRYCDTSFLISGGLSVLFTGVFQQGSHLHV